MQADQCKTLVLTLLSRLGHIGTHGDNGHDGSDSNAIFFRSLTFDQGGNRGREGREETNMGVEKMEATKLSEITGRIFVEVVVMVVMVGHYWMIVT